MIEYTVKVYPNGNHVWYLNGKLHREDGPAVECPNCDRKWFLNNIQYTEEEYLKNYNL